MHTRVFDVPVFVKTEDMTIEEIVSLEDALTFLDKGPSHRRGPTFSTARRACDLALKGKYPVSSARQSFASFAKFMRILNEANPNALAASRKEYILIN